MGTKRVIFHLTDDQDKRLAKLAKELGVQKGEALRRIIELYIAFKELGVK